LPSRLTVDDYISANPFTDKVIEPAETGLLLSDREKEKERLDYVVESAAGGFPQNIAILGEVGVGKSSMLNYVQAGCQLKKGVFFSRINVTEDTSEETLVRSLVKDLLDQASIGLGSAVIGLLGVGKKKLVKHLDDSVRGIDITRSIRRDLGDPLIKIVTLSSQIVEKKGRPEDVFEVLQLLKEAMGIIKGETKAIAVLFDEAGYVAKERSIALLQRMKLIFQSRPFMLCVAGSPMLFSEYSRVEPTFPNLFLPHNRLSIGPLDLSGTRELIQKRLALVRKKGKETEPFGEKAVQTVHTESDGNPRRIMGIAGYALYLCRGMPVPIGSESIVKASEVAIMTLGKEALDRLRGDMQEICLAIAKCPGSTFEQIRAYLARVTRSEIPKSTINPKINELEKLGYITIERTGREKRCFLRGFLQKYCGSIADS
jgi:hypothetical protein